MRCKDYSYFDTVEINLYNNKGKLKGLLTFYEKGLTYETFYIIIGTHLIKGNSALHCRMVLTEKLKKWQQ